MQQFTNLKKTSQRSRKHFTVFICICFLSFFLLVEASFSITTNVRQAIQYMQKTLYTPSGGRGSNPVIEIGTNLTRNGIGNNIRAQGSIGVTSVCTTSFGACKAIPELVSRGSTPLVGNKVLKVDASATNDYTITNSQITDDGTTVKIPGVLEVNTSITVKSGSIFTILDPTKITSSIIYTNLLCTIGTTPTCYNVANIPIASNYYTKTEIDNATGALRQFVVNNYTTTGVFNRLSGDFYDLSGRLATQYWTINQATTYMNANYTTTGMYNVLSGTVWNLSGRLATNYYTKAEINVATGLIRNAINSLNTRTTNLETRIATVESSLDRKIEGEGSENKIAMRGPKNTLTESIITQTNGNIGIDVQEPTQKLEVNGAIRLTLWERRMPRCDKETVGTILFAEDSGRNMNFYGCVAKNETWGLEYEWKILNYSR